jgi:Peptidase family S41
VSAAEPFAAFCGRLFTLIDAARPARLVIDMRWNGGGNTFLGQPLLHHLLGCPQINQPGAPFVIIGRNTYSAAQNVATTLQEHTAATFVGEPTGSRPNFIGESVPFELPVSKVQVNISDLYWQTGHPMDHRPWIAPHLYAPPTYDAFSRNHDPALAAILDAAEQLPGA